MIEDKLKWRAVKSFKDACKALGIEPTLPDFSNSPVKHQKALTAHYKLVIIVEAINAGWQPNWADRNERKWQLWLDVEEVEGSASGFGLSCDVYDCWRKTTTVGSRFCFQYEEKARYCFKTFRTLWENYQLIDK